MKKLVGLVFSIIVIFSAVGCSNNTIINEPIDNSKTQLNVANFDGGIGSEWLDNIKVSFEEKYKDTEFEPGKKGVQLRLTNGKTYYTSTLSTSSYHIVFEEAMSYFDLASSKTIMPLTDIVKSVNPIDGKSIESKLSTEQKAVLTALDGEYYALPHYEFYGGIVYDIDVFESKRLYFSEDKNNGNNGFISSLKESRSAGPDGVKGNSDDGLPSTYDEFFILCEYMITKSVTPIIWTGKYDDYVNYLMQALFLNYSGKEQALLNVNFDSGTSKTEIVTSFNGNEPIISLQSISDSTGYLLSQQAGRYYALSFLKQLLSKGKYPEGYYHPLSATGTTAHTDAQEEFIFGHLENKPIGMLIDGSYWFNEAKDDGSVSRAVEEFGKRAESRRFGWMPLPGVVSGAVNETNGKKLTLGDQADSFAVINANISSNDKLTELAKIFIQYCYSDEMLQQFTVTTGTAKAVSYELTQSQQEKLDCFEKNLYTARKFADVVYPMSASPIYINNQAVFSWNIGLDFWKTSISGGGSYRQPISGLKKTDINAKSYFEGMKISQSDWSTKYSKFFK